MPTVTRADPHGSSSPVYSLVQLAQAWQRNGGPGGAVAITAAAIALAESGGRLNASHVNSNGTVDRGPWQINSVHSQYNAQQLVSSLDYNAQAAVAIYKSEGFNAWTTYKSGAYKSTVKPGTALATALEVGGQSPVKAALSGTIIPGVPGLTPGAAADGIKGAFDAATAIPKFVATLGSAIFDPAWWLRVGLIIMGIAALALGATFIGREFAGNQVASIAKTAFKKG